MQQFSQTLTHGGGGGGKKSLFKPLYKPPLSTLGFFASCGELQANAINIPQHDQNNFTTAGGKNNIDRFLG
ncbi:hypothetical protein CUPS9163_07765, partial [Campylobacter upsaliensis]|uniref:hypothetical protein n=1 Tax=Campylobacter upsaliensis TaxID=28080 RepID=UPI002149AB30